MEVPALLVRVKPVALVNATASLNCSVTTAFAPVVVIAAPFTAGAVASVPLTAFTVIAWLR